MNALGQNYTVLHTIRDWRELWAYFLPQLLKRLREQEHTSPGQHYKTLIKTKFIFKF